MNFRVFWDVAPSSHVEANDVSEVRTASIIRAMMEAVCTSETSSTSTQQHGASFYFLLILVLRVVTPCQFIDTC
jgi:hypothetical protein